MVDGLVLATPTLLSSDGPITKKMLESEGFGAEERTRKEGFMEADIKDGKMRKNIMAVERREKPIVKGRVKDNEERKVVRVKEKNEDNRQKELVRVKEREEDNQQKEGTLVEGAKKEGEGVVSDEKNLEPEEATRLVLNPFRSYCEILTNLVEEQDIYFDAVEGLEVYVKEEGVRIPKELRSILRDTKQILKNTTFNPVKCREAIERLQVYIRNILVENTDLCEGYGKCVDEVNRLTRNIVQMKDTCTNLEEDKLKLEGLIKEREEQMKIMEWYRRGVRRI